MKDLQAPNCDYTALICSFYNICGEFLKVYDTAARRKTRETFSKTWGKQEGGVDVLKHHRPRTVRKIRGDRCSWTDRNKVDLELCFFLSFMHLLNLLCYFHYHHYFLICQTDLIVFEVSE